MRRRVKGKERVERLRRSCSTRRGLAGAVSRCRTRNAVLRRGPAVLWGVEVVRLVGNEAGGIGMARIQNPPSAAAKNTRYKIQDSWRCTPEASRGINGR